ncbi:MAG TPA: IclR family transcriptional regulator [Hyphomicrobiales bacterium]|nr:IclR family transcriptional regulator [Hyphomicrobiales bacterium]
MLQKPDDAPAEDSAYLAPPVQRAMRILRHIAEGDPVLNVSQTAKALDINRTTLLRLLYTLEVEGFIEKRPGGAGYQVGLAFLSLAASALVSQDLVQTATPIVARLAEELQLSAHLGVLDGTDVVYLVRRTPNTPLASNIRVGSRLPAHATSMGRAILSCMSAAEVDDLYGDHTLARFSRHTATTLAALHAQLDADRDRRIAWSDAYFEAGISSCAVPVFDHSGAATGAINVSGPVGAFAEPAHRALIDAAIRRAGAELSQRLGWIEPAKARNGR